MKNNNGYISSENEAYTSNTIENNLIIRINCETFEKLVNELVKVASSINFKNVTSEDITESFIDLDARLNNKKEAEKRYIEFMKMAKNVDDVLSVENVLRNIREEIDATEGKLRYWNDQILYSTITLDFYQTSEPIVEKERNYLGKICDSFVQGWHELLFSSLVLISVWPYVIMVIVIIILFRIWHQKRKKLLL